MGSGKGETGTERSRGAPGGGRAILATAVATRHSRAKGRGGGAAPHARAAGQTATPRLHEGGAGPWGACCRAGPDPPRTGRLWGGHAPSAHASHVQRCLWSVVERSGGGGGPPGQASTGWAPRRTSVALVHRSVLGCGSPSAPVGRVLAWKEDLSRVHSRSARDSPLLYSSTQASGFNRLTHLLPVLWSCHTTGREEGTLRQNGGK